jgi:hypothetical protein
MKTESNQMTISAIDDSQRVAAKIAGISFVLSMVIVVFANYVLLSPLVVPGNAAETARNVLAHQTQFRFALTGFLFYSLNSIVLLAALYLIFQRVNQGLALLGALFRLVFAMLWLLSTLNLLNTLRLVSAPAYLQVFQADRLQALARMHIAVTFDDYYVGLPFFGLAATIWAWLWLKSEYIPRKLAIFGVISSAWCVFCAFVFLIFPDFQKSVDPYWFDSPMALFELVVGIWLLTKGIRSPAASAEFATPLFR